MVETERLAMGKGGAGDLDDAVVVEADAEALVSVYEALPALGRS